MKVIKITWFDRMMNWFWHHISRCDGWCSYCITEAEKDGERWL